MTKSFLMVAVLCAGLSASAMTLTPVSSSGAEIAAVASSEVVQKLVEELNAQRIESITSEGDSKYTVSANGCAFNVIVLYRFAKAAEGFDPIPQIRGVEVDDAWICSAN